MIGTREAIWEIEQEERRGGQLVWRIRLIWVWILEGMWMVEIRFLFQSFDKEGLRVSPLKLKVYPSATFRMQPCQFIRDGVLKPIKTTFDQFLSEGVLIPDPSCDFASPFVIVNKKDGGIRMAVDYREVNMQLEATANQLPYQPTLGAAFLC